MMKRWGGRKDDEEEEEERLKQKATVETPVLRKAYKTVAIKRMWLTKRGYECIFNAM